MLLRYKLKAIFFITGHMAEKISNNKSILDILQNHEIGYHSSSHSVRPIIPEFTDVKNYLLAVQISLKRETSHICSLTGDIENDGGIKILREIFPSKEVNSFRAPGLCWSPPHLEAIMKIGIKFDFSTHKIVYDKPLFYKGITFYPTPIEIDMLKLKDLSNIFLLILRNKFTTLFAHPNIYVNLNHWDSIFFDCNPKELTGVAPRSKKYTMFSLYKLKMILVFLYLLRKKGMIEVTPDLETSKEKISVKKINIKDVYKSSMLWCRFFKYKPKFLFSHFKKYFRE